MAQEVTEVSGAQNCLQKLADGVVLQRISVTRLLCAGCLLRSMHLPSGILRHQNPTGQPAGKSLLLHGRKLRNLSLLHQAHAVMQVGQRLQFEGSVCEVYGLAIDMAHNNQQPYKSLTDPY